MKKRGQAHLDMFFASSKKARHEEKNTSSNTLVSRLTTQQAWISPKEETHVTLKGADGPEDDPPKVSIWPAFLTMEESMALFDELKPQPNGCIEWKTMMIATRVGLKPAPRKTVFLTALPSAVYRFSGMDRPADPMPECLKEIMKRVAERVDEPQLNSCLVNYYEGNNCIHWHSDSEYDTRKKGMKDNTIIASLSVGMGHGSARRFELLHKKHNTSVGRGENGKLKKANDGEYHCYLLEPGTLLTMEGSMQKHWHHQVPPPSKSHLEEWSLEESARINITFRVFS